MRIATLILSSAILWSVTWAEEPASPTSTDVSKAKTDLPAAQKPATPVPTVAPKPQTVEPVQTTSASGLSVRDAAVAVGLNEYEPVEPGDLFPAEVKRLYCISRIKGAQDSTEIEHRWYWNDDLISAIPLKVKSNNWRTYSIKTIVPSMTGEWMVAIVNPQKDEEVLQTLKFSVK
jgi:hypothetical protein